MKSWSCIENCGACCRFDLAERDGLQEILSNKDIALINSMTNKDGWCKYFDKSKRNCTIYDSRPHFCRVNEFSTSFKGYLKNGDKFLIDCCKQHISSIYGRKSKQMKIFKSTVSKK
tara:strand:- start:676 stop:1023 length:348 start_codon:yes stop_codon:yes gene_type:complete